MSSPKAVHSFIGLLILGHVLLHVTALETCEAIAPTDTNAKLGEKAVLKCRQGSQNIAWTFCPRNGPPRQIASNCEVNPSSSGAYSVDTTASSCNLVIKNVTTSQLGTYTCQDSSVDDKGHSAQLGNTNENLIKGKNTIQSTTLNDGLTSPSLRNPSFAIDGNPDTAYYHSSCAATQTLANQWWAVDMEQETHVGRVRITARSDNCCPGQLQNFYIGITNVSPWNTPPSSLNQTNICKYFFGFPPAGVPLDIFCEPNVASGRYLYVLKTAADYLVICEIEAYYS